VAGDVFTDSYGSAAFNNKNVGNGKPASVSGISISGADAGNYTFNTTAGTTANITPRGLAVSAQGVNKVYDGNAVATVTLTDDRVTGDVLTDSYTSAAFNDKNVATGKPVSVTGISISGTDFGNYTVNLTASTVADITKAPLTVKADGKAMSSGGAAPTFTATSTGFALGDSVSSLSGAPAFQVKDGSSNTVAVGPTTPAGSYRIIPSGYTSSNYNITFTEGTLFVSQRIDGFFSPVDMTVGAQRVYNLVKGGSTVPLKFRVFTGANPVTTTAGMSIGWNSVTCVSGEVDETVIPATATGGTGLRYDAGGGQFIFNWSVPSSPNKCYQITVQLSDGTTLTNAYFKTK
jgi:hypothetical protein